MTATGDGGGNGCRDRDVDADAPSDAMPALDKEDDLRSALVGGRDDRVAVPACAEDDGADKPPWNRNDATPPENDSVPTRSNGTRSAWRLRPPYNPMSSYSSLSAICTTSRDVPAAIAKSMGATCTSAPCAQYRACFHDTPNRRVHTSCKSKTPAPVSFRTPNRANWGKTAVCRRTQGEAGEKSGRRGGHRDGRGLAHLAGSQHRGDLGTQGAPDAAECGAVDVVAAKTGQLEPLALVKQP